ncbi:hypothetical protein [Tritonibacter mobilis]|uniref:Uncharacterized protein n=1 Tax=Tritonibacter mobilis F1926 TaxID=1265309 RepID=A0A1B1A012_9RHOB|nr:hypothetical protein [Tritonibacter mobilis]ANP39934.1 hypothetical protein K529_004070 [Tritonibacter mobilis F1926]KJZ22491.1 hypothetical protein TW79_17950 [Tritonibacter mobilis]
MSYGIEMRNADGSLVLEGQQTLPRRVFRIGWSTTFTGSLGTFPDFDENRGALMMAPLGFRYTIYDNFVHGENAGPYARSGEFFYNPISMPTLHWDNSTKELSAVAGETYGTNAVFLWFAWGIHYR